MLNFEIASDDLYAIPNGVDCSRFRPIEGLAPDPLKGNYF